MSSNPYTTSCSRVVNRGFDTAKGANGISQFPFDNPKGDPGMVEWSFDAFIKYI